MISKKKLDYLKEKRHVAWKRRKQLERMVRNFVVESGHRLITSPVEEWVFGNTPCKGDR
jgi:hypothetical protein